VGAVFNNPLLPHVAMAKKNMPSKSSKKSNPTITRLSFEVPSGGGTQFIDVGLGLSCVNRKFFRGPLYYYINSVEVYNDEQGVVDILTAPDNWVTRNAHTRGEKLFDKMNDMVDYPTSGVGLPRYHDFKVYLSDLHRTTGSLSPSMYGVNAAATVHAPDEWAYSQFVSADSDGDMNPADPTQINQEADNFFAHLIGPHVGTSDNWTSVGLIKSYAETRQFPQVQVPNVNTSEVIADPLVNLFDFSTEEQLNDIITQLTDDNDETPYNADYYVGEHADAMQHVARIGTETGLGRVGRASGFCAPYGLICIDPHSFASGSGTSLRVVVNVAVGKYNGVYAEAP